MTTLSTHPHPQLSSSLTPANGRCSELSHEHEIGATENSADTVERSDVVDVGIPTDTVLEDEEIASVEADGTSGMDVDDDRTVEKQLLTAALVTSIVELAGTPHGHRKKSNANVERRRLVRMGHADEAGGEGLAFRVFVSLPLITCLSLLWNLFPTVDSKKATPTVGSGKFNFHKMAPPNRKAECPKAPQMGSRTSSFGSNVRSHAESLTEMEEVSVKGSCVHAGYSIALSAPHDLTPSDGTVTTCHEDVISPNSSSMDNKTLVHQDKEPPHNSTTPSSSLIGKSELSVPPTGQVSAKLTGAPVPNPLAGIQDITLNSNSLVSENISARSRLSKRANSLMSASHATVPGPTLSGKNGSSVQLGGQLADIAESMSSQHYQADGLAALTGSEFTSQGRGRIFSVDLDPAVLDFVENVDPLAEKVDYSAGELLNNHNDTFFSKNPSLALKAGFDSSSGRMPPGRDRGFSFEFFSFGICEDEPLPPVLSSKCDMQFHGNRLRGDSIIFDPTSFCEGGIHETSALLHIKQENEGVRPTGSPCDLRSSDSSAPPRSRPNQKLTASKCNTSNCPHACSAKDNINGPEKLLSPVQERPSFSLKPSKISGLPCVDVQKATLSSHPKLSVERILNTAPQSFTDTTIHMPHGSDAAAAAAAGMSQMSPPSPCDGLSLSHTACPMELLNKGGRIGIYLPEERKARIAKFHSKRKIRIWRKRIKYDCRKKLADSRPRIKGRFVKRSDVSGECSP